MAYEVSFTKKIAVKDPKIYINECCWGGDVVRDRLLPLISSKFENIETTQEDWGWFIWFRLGSIRLAIDIFCDDPENGKFRIHLTARRKRFLFVDKVCDTPELETVREMVCSDIQAWSGSLQVERIDL